MLADALRRSQTAIGLPRYWIQGKMHDGHGYCTLGAIWYCSWMTGASQNQQIKALHAQLPLRYRLLPLSKSTRLALYNDQPGRKHSDIMALWDKALAKLEAEQRDKLAAQVVYAQESDLAVAGD